MEEVSRMTIKVNIRLIVGGGQLKWPLHYCLDSSLGSSLWIPGNFPSVRFLITSIKAPTINATLSLIFLSVLFETDLPVSSILFREEGESSRRVGREKEEMK